MSQTRSFASYGLTGPYIPFQVPAAVSPLTLPVNLVSLDGTVAAANYVQLHDIAPISGGAPTNGAVPLKSYKIAAAGSIQSVFKDVMPITFTKGLCIAMSSTDGTYTAAATTLDVFGEVEEWEGYQPIETGLTTAGDIASGVDQLPVWTSGRHKLVRVDYTNNDPAARWLMLFPISTFADGAIPIAAWKVANGVSQTLWFGRDGLDIFAQDKSFNAQTKCYLVQSSTGPSLTATASSASFMRARYI